MGSDIGGRVVFESNTNVSAVYIREHGYRSPGYYMWRGASRVGWITYVELKGI